MTEKERMAAGQLYLSAEEQLTQERMRARQLNTQYNALPAQDTTQRARVLRELFGSCGEGAWVEQPFYCDYGYNIHVGKNFYANFNCTILDGAKVTIGDNVLLAPSVSLNTAGHPYDVQQRNAGLEYALPITIGNNVWVGGNVVVVPGVTIGDDTIIGAGSVVTHDIPSGVIAAGNPCRVIREITPEDKRRFIREE